MKDAFYKIFVITYGLDITYLLILCYLGYLVPYMNPIIY